MVHLISVLLIVIGIAFNASKKFPGVKDFLETFILGGSIDDDNAPYKSAVKYLGWPAIATGIGLIFPPGLIWDIAGLALLIFVIVRVRVEYAKHRKITEGSSAK